MRKGGRYEQKLEDCPNPCAAREGQAGSHHEGERNEAAAPAAKANGAERPRLEEPHRS